jgi:hypothetical protein
MHFCLFFLKDFKNEKNVLEYIEKIIYLFHFIINNEFRLFAEDEKGINLYNKFLDDVNYLYKISNSIENFIEQGKKLNLQYKEPDNKENLKNEINNLIIDIIHEENNNPYTMMD